MDKLLKFYFLLKKATVLKMARGEMIGSMAENNIEYAEDIKKFNRLDYAYKEAFSTDEKYVFIKRQ